MDTRMGRQILYADFDKGKLVEKWAPKKQNEDQNLVRKQVLF